MSTQLKLRRGTTAQHSTFTGAAGEITVDTDKKTVVVHDGTTAGGSPLATAANPTFTGNLSFSGTAQRITGDFSNGTIANRVMFQTSTVNGSTGVSAIPNGTGVSGAFQAYNNSDPTNAAYAGVSASNIAAVFSSDIRGTGTYLPMAFLTGGSERMRIDTSGNLQVGTTSALSGARFEVTAGGIDDVVTLKRGAGRTVGNLRFLSEAGATVGYVQWSGSTTSYNTSSDYRLKENIQPMQNALAKVSTLKPCTYTWKADGSAGEGFIAHELAEVVPQCVTGEKDAVDEEGNPVYQGIDTSFLVATLTAAIQELKAEFDAYKAAHP